MINDYHDLAYCEHWVTRWQCEKVCKCGHLCDDHTAHRDAKVNNKKRYCMFGNCTCNTWRESQDSV